MTKVIILGEPAEKKEGKNIEFVQSLQSTKNWRECKDVANEWKNVELICKNYNQSSTDPYDLMFAYDSIREEGALYLGHFNDGIV